MLIAAIHRYIHESFPSNFYIRLRCEPFNWPISVKWFLPRLSKKTQFRPDWAQIWAHLTGIDMYLSLLGWTDLSLRGATHQTLIRPSFIFYVCIRPGPWLVLFNSVKTWVRTLVSPTQPSPWQPWFFHIIEQIISTGVESSDFCIFDYSLVSDGN